MGNKGGKVVLTEEIVETISRSSGIETHKIRAECQNFLKDHPRGNMNRRDFRKFLKIALPKIDVKKMEENLFRMYDTNMDGIISMQEFLIVIHNSPFSVVLPPVTNSPSVVGPFDDAQFSVQT